MAINTDLEQLGGPHTRPNLPSEGTPHSHPSGEPIAPGQQPPTAPHSDLPPGAHPNDPSGVDGDIVGHGEETSPPKRTRKAPFSTSNADAFAFFERSAADWRSNVVGVNTNNGGTASVVGRLPGRRSVTLWIPASVVVGGALVTTTNGVLFAATEGELQNGNGTFLGVGDSITIESEASVAIGLVPGTTQGYVQYLDLFDAPGGGITGNT